MRRALASLLLGTLNLPLIGGLLPADPERNLHSCRRRAGQHRCAMAAQSEDLAGSGFQAASRCPLWPKIEAPAPNFQTAAATSAFCCQAPALNGSARDRIHFAPFGRPADSAQKRGPPSWLASII